MHMPAPTAATPCSGTAIASASANSRRMILRDIVGDCTQLIEDRTFRTMVAVAVMHQVLERPGHALQLGDLALQVVDMLPGDTLHRGARARSIAPQAEE